MTATGTPPEPASSDVGDIWKEAIDRWEKDTETKLEDLKEASNTDDVLAILQEREEKFKAHRHNGSKTDKLRTLMSKALDPIDKIGNVVAGGAALAFPPSTTIFTAVRYLISSANTVSADYDKIAGIFEDLVSHLQRFKILEDRIPPLLELKVALARVLAALLVLCGICAKYVKMRRFGKAFQVLVRGEDGELRKALDHFQKMAKEEGDAVLKADLAYTVKTYATTVRMKADTEALVASVGRMDNQSESQQVKFRCDELLDWLSSLNFSGKQEDILSKCHPGTGQWLLMTTEFQAWFNGDQSSILWCAGIPGAGKTVLTSLVINHIEEATQGKNTALAYVYCHYKDEKTTSEIELLSSIIRQVAEQTSPLPLEIVAFRDAHLRRKPTNDEWISLLISIRHLFDTIFVCIDALDICPETNMDRFLLSMQKLEPFIQIFITTRLHIDLRDYFPSVCRLQIQANRSDIERYLRSKIHTNKRLRDFCIDATELEQEIVTGVIEKADGMFLFAYFQIRRLCDQNNLRGVRQTLKAMPKGIDDSYGVDIDRIAQQSEEDCQLAKRALSYIFGAKRTLRAEELRHALAVEDGDTELDEESFPKLSIIFNASAGLIRFDQKSNTVGFVHYTLQQYFEANRDKLLPDIQSLLGRVCLTYLAFNIFGSGPCSDGQALQQRLQVYSFLDYAARNWGHHVIGNSLLMDLVLAYLGDYQKLSSFVQVLHLIPNRTNDWQDRFPKHFGPSHVAAYWGLDEILGFLFQKGIDINNQDSYGQTALQVAAKRGHDSTVQLLLQNEANIHIQNGSGETALYWAARNGHMAIVQSLVIKGAKVMTEDDEGWTALDWAVIGGKVDVLRFLLSDGFDIQSDGKYKALYLAAGEGYEETVKMLLDHGADVNEKDWLGSTALDWAAPGGHVATVQVLLRYGCDLNSRDKYENTALHWAIQHKAVVQLLLAKGADFNARNDCGQTALSWVARDGPLSVAQILLVDYNADVNIRDIYGCTALHGAALKGRADMLHLLLEQGADPNIEDKDGWTSLHVAALKGYEAIVELLLKSIDGGEAILHWVALQQNDQEKAAIIGEILEKKAEGSTVLTGLRVAVSERHLTRLQALLDMGADINAMDVGGSTALIVAADDGYEDAVLLLLQNRADVNINGSRGWPALHWASQGKEIAIVQHLIEYGAEVNARKNGWTAMLLAAKQECLPVVDSLLENGADVNAKDYHGRRALHWAAGAGHTDMVWLLAKNKADLNAVDRWGRTALMWAIENMRSVAFLLMDIGADVKERAQDGSTALHLAAFQSEPTVAGILLKKGASVDARTQDHFTALHIASFRGAEEVVQILLRNGADVEAEARWPRPDNQDEKEGFLANDIGMESLSERLCQILLEQAPLEHIEADVNRALTPRRLAESSGHVKIQRLLGMRGPVSVSKVSADFPPISAQKSVETFETDLRAQTLELRC